MVFMHFIYLSAASGLHAIRKQVTHFRISNKIITAATKASTPANKIRGQDA